MTESEAEENEREYKKQVNELSHIANTKLYEWIKQIVLMESSLLAILVSLHSKSSLTLTIHYTYSAMIIVIAIGILSGVIALYGDINVHYILIRKFKNSLIKAQFEEISVEPLPRHKFCRRLCELTFYIVIPVLVWYAILLDL